MAKIDVITGRPAFFNTVAVLLVLSLFLLSLSAQAWLDFQVAYLFSFVLFVLFGLGLYRSRLYERFAAMPLHYQIAILFLSAFVLRLIFLPNDPVLSDDIYRILNRSNAFVNGLVPYRDFDVKKPPLYIYFIGGFGRVFGG